MEHIKSHHMSLAFMATVLVSAGSAAPVADAKESEGIIRLTRLLPDEPEFQSVAPSEFSLAGLRLYGKLSTMRPLGAPAFLTRNHGEDGRGEYVTTTYHYEGLDVTVARGRIKVIMAKAPGRTTPGGLETGMSRAEALAVLGREPAPEQLDGDAYSFIGCPEWRDGELVWDNVDNHFEFAFGGGGRLSFIRLAARRVHCPLTITSHDTAKICSQDGDHERFAPTPRVTLPSGHDIVPGRDDRCKSGRRSRGRHHPPRPHAGERPALPVR